MQGGRDPFFGFGDPFGSFNGVGGFGGQRSMLSGFFEGRDPFDDPFFTRPGSIFGSSFFGSIGGPSMNLPIGGPPSMNLPIGGPFMNLPIGGPFMNVPSGGPFKNENSSGFLDQQPSMVNKSKGPVIEELTSDDEKDENENEEKKVNLRKHGRSSKEPVVEDPDDVAAEKKSKYTPHKNNIHLLNHGRPQPQTQSFTFQSSTVTYGGANGAHYSSSTRRAGSYGLTLEEFKEANSFTGQATHRVSRGIHEKGHSVTRNLKSDGHVDTMQTLHNLNEDELVGFEEVWLGNGKKHLPGWSEERALQDVMASGSTQWPRNRGGWALPSVERSSNVQSSKRDNGREAGLPHKKTHVNYGTGSSRLRSNGANRH
ncbi:uncharacterized protein LOC142542828 isoform X1 [Primulina tabacum]|uniref:uncharacterized protein LOC142542828 isoform X1 n=1 Tax=Primulina tabacum TaxID=48773 RepID=UPI003F5995EA